MCLDGTENAQWSIEYHSVPSSILIHKSPAIFFYPIYFSASPNSKETKFQVFTTRLVKSCLKSPMVDLTEPKYDWGC